MVLHHRLVLLIPSDLHSRNLMPHSQDSARDRSRGEGWSYHRYSFDLCQCQTFDFSHKIIVISSCWILSKMYDDFLVVPHTFWGMDNQFSVGLYHVAARTKLFFWLFDDTDCSYLLFAYDYHHEVSISSVILCYIICISINIFFSVVSIRTL
jgi:hypothetical protein